MILVFVKRYKKDPVDQTIAINACVIKLMNADFDGVVY